jgi:transcriptional regulator with XRE-family HTH domain
MGTKITFFLRMSLPIRLITLRKENSMTQQAMANTIGIHVNSLKKYEAGQAQPSLDVLKKIAKAMHVSTDFLLFEEHERGPDDEMTLQFEAISQFTEEEKKITKALLESLILKHDANRFSMTG